MKMPREINKYCPKCNTYTKHTVSIYKKRPQRGLSEGGRRYNRKKKGYGSQPKPIQHNQAKITKKITPIIRCKKCNYQRYMRSVRGRRMEIV
ncbi:MAG: 50S ribosomal protein L44e [Promethearchaeota archaeon]|nr:MAG: 50S ribosomal protein L44e [Candidatus Lokiarchaeota archaeon]